MRGSTDRDYNMLARLDRLIAKATREYPGYPLVLRASRDYLDALAKEHGRKVGAYRTATGVTVRLECARTFEIKPDPLCH